MNYTTQTATSTYTVVDIRKTFEGFQADLRMIARRTEKWTQDYVENVCHDIVHLAENKFLDHVDIILLDIYEKPLRATRYTVTADGKTITGDRAGGNDWQNIPGSALQVILFYTSSWRLLTEEAKNRFRTENGFKVSWSPSAIDTSYTHLQQERAQIFASNGFELHKTNFK